MTCLGDGASGENRASVSVVLDDDGVSRCRYLREAILYIVLIV
jgi:hypothetical protein